MSSTVSPPVTHVTEVPPPFEPILTREQIAPLLKVTETAVSAPGRVVEVPFRHPRHGVGTLVGTTASFFRVRFANSEHWIPRPDRKRKLRNDRHIHEDRGKAVRQVSPEHYPEGYEPVQLHSEFPSHKLIRKLAGLGYPKSSLLALLPVTPTLHRAPVFDRHQYRCASSSEIEGHCGRDAGNKHSFYDPNHPVVAAPTRVVRLARGRQIPERIFSQLIQSTRHDLPMQAALREVLVVGCKVVTIAEARHLSYRALSEAARILRKKACADEHRAKKTTR
jgi:hypothetical protein